jgi:hypothetical protein
MFQASVRYSGSPQPKNHLYGGKISSLALKFPRASGFPGMLFRVEYSEQAEMRVCRETINGMYTRK